MIYCDHCGSEIRFHGDWHECYPTLQFYGERHVWDRDGPAIDEDGVDNVGYWKREEARQQAEDAVDWERDKWRGAY